MTPYQKRLEDLRFKVELINREILETMEQLDAIRGYLRVHIDHLVAAEMEREATSAGTPEPKA